MTEQRQPQSSERGDYAKKLPTIILLLVFAVGLSLLLYPTFSDYWNSLHQTRAIVEYAESVADLDTEAYAAMLEAAVTIIRSWRRPALTGP